MSGPVGLSQITPHAYCGCLFEGDYSELALIRGVLFGAGGLFEGDYSELGAYSRGIIRSWGLIRGFTVLGNGFTDYRNEDKKIP